MLEILKESKTRIEASFISSGNSYATPLPLPLPLTLTLTLTLPLTLALTRTRYAGLRLGARTSLRGAIAEATQGVTYYESVKQLLQQATLPSYHPLRQRATLPSYHPLHQATDDWPSPPYP